uniref:Uncharacterized protein n=1 Tax=Amphimedon queenslandica TaxID=400682 RepID=A0A1X7VY72_AMPQE
MARLGPGPDPPLVMAQGSADPSLSNANKRYSLYRKFWSLLARLRVWEEPQYVALKETFTSSDDRREVMPVCIVTELRRRYPNLPGVLYTDFQPS